jgi:acyl-CoA thioesterase
MSEIEMATRIVDRMFNNDPMSQWLGIRRVQDGPGISVLTMIVRKDMLNGFGIAHGGVSYSLADSALAFASNAHGIQAVSIETSISHVAQSLEGDELITRVVEKSLTPRTGLYHIDVMNQNGKVIAYFKGTVFRTGKPWEI